MGELGRGASSVVYRAKDLATGREVALKSAPADRGETMKMEYRRLHRLRHPGLVRVFDLHLSDDRALLSLELLETDRSYWNNEGGETSAASWSQLASALRHLHSRGLVHGDIKPENIGWSSGRAKLMDLGLSGRAGDGSDRTFSGTPAYASPEMLDQGIFSPAGDIYSLGLVLWEAAGGRLPSPEQKLDPSEAWLNKMPGKLTEKAAELMRGMLRYRRLDRLADGGQLVWAMAEAGLLKDSRFLDEMPLSGRASELRRAMRAVRRGERGIRIIAKPGIGASRFLDELVRLMQLEGHVVWPTGQGISWPSEANTGGWWLIDRDDDVILEYHKGRPEYPTAVPVSEGSELPTIELGELARRDYLRILEGIFHGSSYIDLDGLAGWLEGQAGGHVPTVRILLEQLLAGGFIKWVKHRWSFDWQAILGLDVARTIAMRWEGPWRLLGEGHRGLLREIALSGILTPGRDHERYLAKLSEWLRQTGGAYRFVGEAVRGFVLETCSDEDCGRAEYGDVLVGKLSPVTPVLEALERAGRWQAWKRLGLKLFRQACGFGDFEASLFYGRKLAESRKLDDEEVTEVLSETAKACRALGRFQLGLDLLERYGSNVPVNWAISRASMVLSIGAEDLKKAADLAKKAADVWSDEKAISLEAKLFLGLTEGMAQGRDKGEKIIIEVQNEPEAQDLPRLQQLAFQFRATLAHLAGDWCSVVANAKSGLKLGENQFEPLEANGLVNMLGNSLVQLGKLEEAEKVISDFIDRYENILPSSDLSSLNAIRGLAALKNGNWELAYHCFVKAERHTSVVSNPKHEATLVSNMSIVLGARGQHRSEADKHLQAYHIFKEAGDLGNALLSLGNHGVKKKVLGQNAEAFAILRECLDASRENGLENVRLLAAKNLGLAEFEEGNLAEALKMFRESNQSAEAAGLSPNFETALYAMLSHALSGDVAAAKNGLSLVPKLVQNRQQEIWVEYAEGMIMSQEGGEGLPKMLQAIGQMREQGRLRDAAVMALTVAESRSSSGSGDHLALISALLDAEAEFGRLGDQRMQVRVRQAIVQTARELVTTPGAAAGQEMLEAFYQLAFLLRSGAGPVQVGKSALEQAVKLTEAERGGLFIVGDDGKPELLSGVNLDQSTIRDAYDFSARALGQAGLEGAEVVSNDAQADGELSSRESVKRNTIRSLACMPLQFREGVGGALYLDSRLRPGIFSAGRRQFLRALSAVVGAVLESSRLMESLRAGREQPSELDLIKGSSPPVAEMKLRIRKAAGARVNVLIEGETGTGKELAARAIHSLSDRRSKPFVALDCGSLPETLLEAELFGHIKGAFTGAHADKPGLFEAADGGTMFLDEITSASLAVQARLLRVIEEGEVRRVGDTRVRRVDVRLICAANKDMEFEMGEGRFKPDLYYRLNEFRISIPPLRDRGKDILSLAEYFLRKYSKLHGKKGLVYSPSARKAMIAYPWSGNIREMENAVQKAVIMAGQSTITEQDLELPAVFNEESKKPSTTRSEIKRGTLVALLREYGNNTALVAEKLSISRRQVQRLIRKHRIAT